MSSKRKYKDTYVRRRRVQRDRVKRCVLIISGVALFILIICGIFSLIWKGEPEQTGNTNKILPKITLDVKLLKINKYSRPGIPLKKVNGIVVHYTANPGSDADENRNYFNNLPRLNKGKKNPTYASSHFVIGLEGQIVQCIPTNEMAYASNDRNSDTISIECCHPDKTGKFNDITYQTLVELLSFLCIKYDLSEGNIIRHFDVTGKKCPLYFVEHEDEWEQLKKDVGLFIDQFVYNSANFHTGGK